MGGELPERRVRGGAETVGPSTSGEPVWRRLSAWMAGRRGRYGPWVGGTIIAGAAVAAVALSLPGAAAPRAGSAQAGGAAVPYTTAAAPGPSGNSSPLSAPATAAGRAAPSTPAAPAARASRAAWTAAERYLYYYHHYADFTPAQCRELPSRFVAGCLYGAKAQDITQHRPDPIAERQRLFAEYVHGVGFSHAGCLLLPTDTVEGCQERFPARHPRSQSQTTQVPSMECAGASGTVCTVTTGAGTVPVK